MLTTKPKNGILAKEVPIVPKSFRPNAFLVMLPRRPILVVFLSLPAEVEADIAISARGLSWNTVTAKRLSDNYHMLVDYLLEKLPKERKFKGGVFYAQIHKGAKIVPWENKTGDDLALAIHLSSKRLDDVCVKNLRITIGDYAGDSI